MNDGTTRRIPGDRIDRATSSLVFARTGDVALIRAFVENLAVDGVNGTGELRTKRIPDALSIRDSFKVVAGTGFEPATFGL